MLSFFALDVFDDICDVIESVSEGFLTYSLKEIQSLLGKLIFVAACVSPARLSISTMLTWLKALYKSESGQHVIPNNVRKDLLWWHKY